MASAVALAASVSLGFQPAALATPHLTFDDINSFTYKEIKGSGIANTCPLIEASAPSTSDMPTGKHEIEQFCLEPTAFYVKEEGEDDFHPTKVLTRQTYTLDMITGEADLGKSGPQAITLNQDGLDYASVVLQEIPAGKEYIPVMFTARNMSVAGTNGELLGEYVVPAYRGSAFMDTKGRGASSGYDYAIGLAAAGDANYEEYARMNNKTFAPTQGQAKLTVATMDPDTKEAGGTFELVQVSSDDMGAKDTKDVAVVGVWYARMG